MIKVLIDGHHNEVIGVKDIGRVVGVSNAVDELDRRSILVDGEEMNHLVAGLQLRDNMVHGLVHHNRLGEGDGCVL